MLNRVSSTPSEVQEEILRYLDGNGAELGYMIGYKIFGSYEYNRTSRNVSVLKKKGYVTINGNHVDITSTGKSFLRNTTSPPSEYRWLIKAVTISNVNGSTHVGEDWEPFTSNGTNVFFRKLVEA